MDMTLRSQPGYKRLAYLDSSLRINFDAAHAQRGIMLAKGTFILLTVFFLKSEFSMAIE